MKTQVLKSLIKQAVKEAIQEELKEVLLEAVRAPKQMVNESNISPVTKAPPTSISNDKREAYRNILGDMQTQYTSQDVPKSFNPAGTMPGGDLPEGEVDMAQIMGLMNR